MPCDILDLRCIFLNEIFGSLILTLMFVAILYFIAASKLRLGFDTTIAFSVPLILLGGLAFGGFTALYAFLTVIVGIMFAWVFQKIIKN